MKKLNIPEKKPTIEIETVENTKIATLKKAIETSSYFQNSKIDINATKDSLIIDDSYEIIIKTGYYQMTIKDTKQESTYCKIVDAIEQNLGLKEGKSIDTCEKTLEGSINIGGINAEIYDTYKVLSVNIDTPASLYNIESTHESGDLIPIEKVNYNIKIDNYLLTSMKPTFNENSKLFNICGNIYNKNKKASNNFKITLYDTNKNKLDSKTYKYENKTQKYIPFCVEYPLEINTVKFYSISKIKEKK